jgi:UDP-N-acetylglucosamine 2-epimerase
MVAMDRNSLCDEVGFDPAQPFLLVTFHPETNVADEVNARFAAQARIALLATPMQVLMTAPCADPGNEAFLQLCEQLGQERAGFRYVPSLGLKRYVAALRHAAAMLGNSSSGIIESATMGLPVVNVGRRQHLRDRAANVLDCAFDAPSMLNAIDQATSAAFVATSRQVRNPYGEGQFVTHALKALAKVKWPLPVDKSWDFARSV